MSEHQATEVKPAAARPLRKRRLMFRLWLLRNFLPTATTVVLFWAGIVGVVGAVLGLTFRFANETLQSLIFQHDSGHQFLSAAERILSMSPPWIGYLWIGLAPAGGGLVAGFILLFGERITKGAKSPELLEAVAVRDGVMKFRPALLKSFSSLFSISSGGSIGREGAIVQLSAMMASKLGQWRRASPQRLRLLVGCGVASGIAAAYNAPIAGALFATEIILGNFAMDVFGPVVFSSVLATAVTQMIVGREPLFGRVEFQMVSAWELIPYILFGAACGVVAPLFRSSLKWFKAAFDSLRLPLPLKLFLGGLVVGAIGIFAPPVLGNGFEATGKILSGDQAWGSAVGVVGGVLVMKVLATSAAVGSGAVGGIFTPTLFVGAAFGSLFGAAIGEWAPFASGGRGAYALVGMGGLLAGTTHAPLMAILMIFEMSLDYSVILPLMLCCVVSSFMSRRLQRESIYTEPLREHGGAWRATPEALVMTSIKVREVMQGEPEAVRNDAPFAEVVDKFFRSRRNNIYVVDSDGRFLGAISLHDLKELLHKREELSFLVAHDLLNADFPVVTLDEQLAQVLEKFWRQDCERLPVVEDLQTRRLVGSISKRDIFGVYGREILHKDFLLARFAQSAGGAVESRFVELPPPYLLAEVTVPETLDGVKIGEAELSRRFGLLALTIKTTDVSGRETSSVVGAAQKLRAGDRLVVLGTAEDIERFRKISGLV